MIKGEFSHCFLPGNYVVSNLNEYTQVDYMEKHGIPSFSFHQQYNSKPIYLSIHSNTEFDQKQFLRTVLMPYHNNLKIPLGCFY